MIIAYMVGGAIFGEGYGATIIFDSSLILVSFLSVLSSAKLLKNFFVIQERTKTALFSTFLMLMYVFLPIIFKNGWRGFSLGDWIMRVIIVVSFYYFSWKYFNNKTNISQQ
jgi:hypothetical protein